MRHIFRITSQGKSTLNKTYDRLHGRVFKTGSSNGIIRVIMDIKRQQEKHYPKFAKRKPTWHNDWQKRFKK